MAQPAAVAIFAAAILVAMPPEPTADAEPPPMASISGVMSRISGMSRAVELRLGSAVYRPDTSDSNSRQSELVICATLAASRSLSP